VPIRQRSGTQSSLRHTEVITNQMTVAITEHPARQLGRLP
jgi:hypothetical protein